jgi:hypothetical protein
MLLLHMSPQLEVEFALLNLIAELKHFELVSGMLFVIFGDKVKYT